MNILPGSTRYGPVSQHNSLAWRKVAAGGLSTMPMLHGVSHIQFAGELTSVWVHSLSRKHDDALKIAHSGRPGPMPIASIDVPVM